MKVNMVFVHSWHLSCSPIDSSALSQITKEDRGWSYLFTTCEDAKRRFPIEDYSVSQTSLEQVFVEFAAHQNTSDGTPSSALRISSSKDGAGNGPDQRVGMHFVPMPRLQPGQGQELEEQYRPWSGPAPPPAYAHAPGENTRDYSRIVLTKL